MMSSRASVRVNRLGVDAADFLPRLRQSVAFLGMMVVAAVFALTPHDSFAAGKRTKLDRVLAGVVRDRVGAPVRVIVRTVPGKRAAVANLLMQRGRRIHAEHRSLEAFTTTVDGPELAALEHHPDVAGVSIDAVVSASQTDVTNGGDVLRGALGVDGQQRTGDGVRIALIDSGLEISHELPRGRVDSFFDFTRGGVAVAPFDDYGHGTHIAGLIAANGSYSQGQYRGIAPGVRFLVYKVLDRNGAGYSSDVIRALEHIVANQARQRVDIVNLSLGHPIYEPAATDPLVRAVEAAVAKGIVVVVSAGNNGKNEDTGEAGYAGINSPGNARSAITVGAVDTNGTIRRADDAVPVYSSRGPTWYDAMPKPDIVAPGHRLVSTTAVGGSLHANNPQLQVVWKAKDGPRYLRLSGTSMAAGVTSGVAALVIEASRLASAGTPSPNLVKGILQYSAVAVGGADELTQGTGSLNAAGALRLAASIDKTQSVGTWWLTTTVLPTDTFGGETVLWGERLIWGDKFVWGDLFSTNQDAWQQSVVWGDKFVWGSKFVWGDKFVWSSKFVWGSNIVWGEDALGVAGLLPGGLIDWDSVTADRLIWGDLAALGATAESAATIANEY